jgi:hypothetical protein
MRGCYNVMRGRKEATHGRKVAMGGHMATRGRKDEANDPPIRSFENVVASEIEFESALCTSSSLQKRLPTSGCHAVSAAMNRSVKCTRE